MTFIDAEYKIDIRDWKETGRELNERIDKECANFKLMHYNKIVMTTKQHDDLAKVRDFVTFDDSKAKLYRTNKGYVMEVTVDDN